MSPIKNLTLGSLYCFRMSSCFFSSRLYMRTSPILFAQSPARTAFPKEPVPPVISIDLSLNSSMYFQTTMTRVFNGMLTRIRGSDSTRLSSCRILSEAYFDFDRCSKRSCTETSGFQASRVFVSLMSSSSVPRSFSVRDLPRARRTIGTRTKLVIQISQGGQPHA